MTAGETREPEGLSHLAGMIRMFHNERAFPALRRIPWTNFPGRTNFPMRCPISTVSGLVLVNASKIKNSLILQREHRG